MFRSMYALLLAAILLQPIAARAQQAREIPVTQLNSDWGAMVSVMGHVQEAMQSIAQQLVDAKARVKELEAEVKKLKDAQAPKE